MAQRIFESQANYKPGSRIIEGVLKLIRPDDL